MQHFEITFTSYNSNEGRVISREYFCHAEDFESATDLAMHMVRGMNDADPARKYAIVKICATGYGGKQADGPGLFEIHESETE